MSTRNILDKNGNVIGTLTLPDETSEEIWTERLSAYLGPPEPAEPTTEDLARAAVTFGQDLIIKIGTESEMIALTTEQMVQLIQVAAPVQLMLMTGALGTALVTLQNTDFQGLLTTELVQKYVSLLQNYLGTAP